MRNVPLNQYLSDAERERAQASLVEQLGAEKTERLLNMLVLDTSVWPDALSDETPVAVVETDEWRFSVYRVGMFRLLRVYPERK